MKSKILITLLLISALTPPAEAGKVKSGYKKDFFNHLSRGQLKEAEADLKNSPEDNLSWARLKYQKGDYPGAVKAYEAIPRSSREFIRSREELGWAYLRAGDLGALRGLLAHLNSDIVPLEQRLEGRVLSAISNLKQCQYDGVKQDIREFQRELLPLAKKLDGGAQNARLKPLVAEAVLKMRYVKLELLSQMQWLEKLKSKPELVAANLAATGQGAEESKKAIAQAAENKLIFPVDKDIWVDELFKVRALSQSDCESIQRGQQ